MDSDKKNVLDVYLQENGLDKKCEEGNLKNYCDKVSERYETINFLLFPKRKTVIK